MGEQTTLADRKRQAGQRMLIGLAGPGVDDDLRRLVREIQPAGFVLFARNVEEPRQVLELNRELASLVDPHRPALLAIDQEGGRVQRVRAPATRWPAMRVVGAAEAHTTEVSTAMAIELRAMGFNLNFAPVADVDSNPANPVIGDRSFSPDPEQVARHVAAFIEAHQAEGIIACAKHFPGHGDTSVDSHLDLPIVDREEPDLEHCELRPFRAAIAAGVGSIMTAHVVFPVWDEDRPATLSPAIGQGVLRQRLGFDGVVFSDDMEMKAVYERWTTEQQVEYATEAGVDAFLCCHPTGLRMEMFEALVRLQEEDAWSDKASRDSAKRMHAMRVRFLARKRPPVALADVVGSRTHLDLAALVTARGS
jgi:beta-N-acetylhexosaminidase